MFFIPEFLYFNLLLLLIAAFYTFNIFFPVLFKIKFLKITAINSVNEESDPVDIEIIKSPPIFTILTLLVH